MKTKIIISQELNDYIEGLSYDLAALKDLLNQASCQTNSNIDTLTYWTDKYIQTYQEYEIAKQEMVKQYITPIIGDKKVNWYLDFGLATIIIEENEIE